MEETNEVITPEVEVEATPVVEETPVEEVVVEATPESEVA